MKTWQEFLPTAARVVAATAKRYPHAAGVVAFGAGETDTAFDRRGGGASVKSFGVPDGIASLIDQNAASSGINPALASQQNARYSILLQDTPQAQPGFSTLESWANIDPGNYQGKVPLANIASQDPFSTAYETSTANAYNLRAADALSQVASGPDAVRGADARTGIMQGVTADQLARNRSQEVRQARLQDASLVGDAAKSMAGIEQARTQTGVAASGGLQQLVGGVAERGLGAARGVDTTKDINAKLLQLASMLRGTTHESSSENMVGKGNQAGWQGGITCCFIFNTALNGALPWTMELARVEYWTPAREKGYTAMAYWLVPAMRASKRVRKFVNNVLIRPFLRYADWCYGERTDKMSAMLAPYCHMWLHAWSALGKLVR